MINDPNLANNLSSQVPLVANMDNSSVQSVLNSLSGTQTTNSVLQRIMADPQAVEVYYLIFNVNMPFKI